MASTPVVGTSITNNSPSQEGLQSHKRSFSIKVLYMNNDVNGDNETYEKLKGASLGAILCKNQSKWEMKNFEPPTQIYMEVGPHEGCSKMSII